jgi:hypothetical protein
MADEMIFDDVDVDYYSSDLLTLVANLLKVAPNRRPTAARVYAMVTKERTEAGLH